MERLEVTGAVRPIYGSLGVKRLSAHYDQVNGRNKWSFCKTLIQVKRHKLFTGF